MTTRRSVTDIMARVSGMSAAEISNRLRQEAAKRLDLLRYRVMTNGARSAKSARATAEPGRFFFDYQDIPEILSTMRKHMPGQVNAIVAEAEQIRAHRFRLLGYRDIHYGTDIDWHLDAVHQKTSPRKPWFKINYFNFDEVGDPKIIWELNRHQHFVVLAKAYRLTGDRRFADELFAQWYSWQEHNPYPIGINWASSLEVAFRSLSWLWVNALLRWTDAVPAGFSSDLYGALVTAAGHINRYLSTYTSPNTHLLGEGVGLFFIGTLCPEVVDAKKWQQAGWQIILEEAGKQVRPDGFHFEQSTYYHVYALDFFLHARMLASRNGIEIPASLDDTLLRMMNVLCTLGQGGAAPAFGDDDGGRVFDSSRNRREHFFDPLAAGAVLFQRGDFKHVARNVTEEALWLLGAGAVDRFQRIANEPAGSGSTALRDSGVYVMVNSRREQLVVDAGPQGTHSAGHGHSDALSLHLSVNGREILSDPGSFEYGGDGAGRRWFRSTPAHNTMQVDQRDQAEQKAPFAWSALPQTRVQRWITGREFDVFHAGHNGYERLANPVTHERWIVNFKRGVWLLRDVAHGSGEHELDIAWHLAPEIPEDAALTGAPYGSASVMILPSEERAWTASGKQEWWSPAYGRKVPGTTLHQTFHGALPAELANILNTDTAVKEPASFRRPETDNKNLIAYEYTSGSTQYWAMFAPGGAPWLVAEWSSDADLLCAVVVEGEPQAILLCNGTYVDRRNQRILSSARPVSWCELVRRGADYEVDSPERDFVTLQPGSDAGEPVSAIQSSERLEQ